MNRQRRVPRFQIVGADEASRIPNYPSYGGDPEHDYSTYLFDTATGRLVFCDGMEPEDAILSRDLRPLVDLLNELGQK